MLEFVMYYAVFGPLIGSLLFVYAPFEIRRVEGSWNLIAKIATGVFGSLAVVFFAFSAYAATFIVPAEIVGVFAFVVAFAIVMIVKEYVYHLKRKEKDHY